MYDEFEKAITGRRARRGLSPLGWILATFGFFFVVGVVGIGFVAYQVANRIEGVKRELGVGPNLAAARMASRLASADELVSLDPERGLALLADLDGGRGPADLLKALTAPAVQSPDGSAQRNAGDAGAAEGGSVRIRSGEGDVSFDLTRTDEGGSLTIGSREGRVRFDLVGGDDGGRLHIEADGARIEAAFGGDAEAAPSWVEGLGRLPSRVEPVISLSSERGRLGAIAWEADADPAELLASYQRRLEDEGYEVRAEHQVRDRDAEHGSLWARNETDGRMVFVVAHRERGRSGVLMGYGEER